MTVDEIRRAPASRNLLVACIATAVLPIVGVLAAIPEFTKGRAEWGVILLLVAALSCVGWYVILT